MTERITLRHLASKAGMSVAGVSKILRGAYKATTPKGRRRVDEVTALARRLGYIANGSARRLRSGRQRALAVLVPVDDAGHPDFLCDEFITGIAAALSARRHGLTLLTYPRYQPALAVAQLGDRDPDAVIVLESASPELERFLERAGLPALYLNVAPRPGLATMTRDEYFAARSVMEVTLGLGYRRFLIAGGWGPDSHFSHLRRAAGIADAATAAGVTCVYNGVAHWWGGFDESIAACAPDPETLVLAIDAVTALRLPTCLPARQPIACCDDSHLFISVAPRMTRACYDRAALGRLAAEQLMARLLDSAAPVAPTVIGSRVLVGESTPKLDHSPSPI
jgi:DNA-binding LacI/PurR family transcriptional regulator